MGKIKLVILAAGKPIEGLEPVPLRETNMGISTLHWILQSCGCTVEETALVGGYRLTEIQKKYPALKIVENLNWKSTSSFESLLLVKELNFSDTIIICFGDILFNNDIVAKIMSDAGEVCIAYDSLWRNRFPGRTTKELSLREKVVVNLGQATRLGVNIPNKLASGEFVGIVKYTRSALIDFLTTMEMSLDNDGPINLSEALEHFRIKGKKIFCHDILGKWAEYNDQSDIARFYLGTKAETLNRLSPLTRKSKILDQVLINFKNWRANSESVLSDIKGELGFNNLIVRSSAKSEDTFTDSNAGGYESVLNVSGAQHLKESVQRVFASYGDKLDSEDQVLVQPMASDVIISGVVFTRTIDTQAPWYVINYSVGSDTEEITSGKNNNHHTWYLHRNAKFCSCGQDERLSNLIEAVKELEFLLNHDHLDIEFAINKSGQIYILQVRPLVARSEAETPSDQCYERLLTIAENYWSSEEIAAPHLPKNAPAIYGIMPDWNPAEIIGTAPSRLAVSLYRYLIMDDTWARQRHEYGYRDARPCRLLKEFCGQPYVDVRASFTSFIPSSITDELAEKLLKVYLKRLKENPQLHDKVEFEVLPTCHTPYFDIWYNSLREMEISRQEIEKLEQALKIINRNAFNRYQNDLNTIEKLDTKLIELQNEKGLSYYNKLNSALYFCKTLGTLPFAHLARGAFVSMAILKDAVRSSILSENALQEFLSSIRTVSHIFISDAADVKSKKMPKIDFIKKYGHLRPGSYDIMSSRYDSDITLFIDPVINSSKIYEENTSTKTWDAEKHNLLKYFQEIGVSKNMDAIELFLRKTIEGREYAKFIFSRTLSYAMDTIIEVGDEYQLSKDKIQNLPVSKILDLCNTDNKVNVDRENLNSLISNEQFFRNATMSIKLPPLITHKSQLRNFVIAADRPNFIGSKNVTAKPLFIDNSQLRKAQNLDGKIIIIEQADPGFDWLFGYKISGLVTKFGGANSHMAIRSAEFGLSAAIGIGEVRFEQLCGSNLIELDPVKQLIKKIL